MARKARKPRAKKPPNPKKPRKPPTFHEQSGAGSAGKVRGAAAAPRSMSVGGSSASAVIELVASESAAGLATVVLELAGEGRVSLASALSAWQHEQERVSNRVWRRPGGLARMGGL